MKIASIVAAVLAGALAGGCASTPKPAEKLTSELPTYQASRTITGSRIRRGTDDKGNVEGAGYVETIHNDQWNRMPGMTIGQKLGRR